MSENLAVVGRFTLDDGAVLEAHDEQPFWAYGEVPEGRVEFLRLVATRGLLRAIRADEATHKLYENTNDQWVWVEDRGEQNPEFSLSVRRFAASGAAVDGYEHAVFSFEDEEY